MERGAPSSGFGRHPRWPRSLMTMTRRVGMPATAPRAPLCAPRADLSRPSASPCSVWAPVGGTLPALRPLPPRPLPHALAWSARCSPPLPDGLISTDTLRGRRLVPYPTGRGCVRRYHRPPPPPTTAPRRGSRRCGERGAGAAGAARVPACPRGSTSTPWRLRRTRCGRRCPPHGGRCGDRRGGRRCARRRRRGRIDGGGLGVGGGGGVARAPPAPPTRCSSSLRATPRRRAAGTGGSRDAGGVGARTGGAPTEGKCSK